LKDIGIPLGHRRKILAAAGELAATAARTPARTVSSEPKTAAERRQITVLFADRVRRTELSMRMDPEDLRDITAEYRKCVSETIQRFDGFVAKYMGDGVLAYFGYPEAHEDDPQRAIKPMRHINFCREHLLAARARRSKKWPR
jgi:class 3 adenylate cyclase